MKTDLLAGLTMARKKNKKGTTTRTTTRHPIADKLVRKLRRHSGAKVVDLRVVTEGKERAAELQKSVAGREALADHHPVHAFYVAALNQMSLVAEQLTLLREMDRFTRLIESAETEYMPSGPPMSPLTRSFFTCWALFDAGVGLEKETLGSIAMAVGRTLGMGEELLEAIGLLQDSHMAVYMHEGTDGDDILLRELVTGQVRRSICPSGYDGRPGELWYTRVLPPPLPELHEHVVFTTPYVLLEPGEPEWQAYFDRSLGDCPPDERFAAYEKHMKWGPTRDHWTEFVLEGYVNHISGAIYLEGLPDVPKSRPHSQVHE